MPTYDYLCDGCQHTFELFQGISDKVKRKCPKCGKPKLRRLIGTGGGILFKGSGFYITDYRSRSYKEKAKQEKSGESSPGPAAPSPDSSAGGSAGGSSGGSSGSGGGAAGGP